MPHMVSPLTTKTVSFGEASKRESTDEEWYVSRANTQVHRSMERTHARVIARILALRRLTRGLATRALARLGLALPGTSRRYGLFWALSAEDPTVW